MKFILSITLTFFIFFSEAQTFDDYIQNASKFYKEKEYQKSAENYSKAFELEGGNVLQYYDAACSLALANDTVSAIKYLELCAYQGWINLKHLDSDTDLSILRNHEKMSGIRKKVQANIDYSEKDLDKDLKKQLEDIYVRDQTLRQLLKDAESKFGKKSDEIKYYWELISQEDSLNELELVKLIEEKGWLGKSVVGGKANMAIWLVIQHASLETQEKYLPLLQHSVSQGESQWNHLALLEDRIQIAYKKRQTYGSQIKTDSLTGKYTYYDIIEPQYVNQRRSEVGLGPIEEYLKIWGIDWTIEQQTYTLNPQIKEIKKVFEHYITQYESMDSFDNNELVKTNLALLKSDLNQKEIEVLLNLWMYYDPADFSTREYVYKVFKRNKTFAIQSVKQRIENPLYWETEGIAPYSDLTYLLKELQ